MSYKYEISYNLLEKIKLKLLMIFDKISTRDIITKKKKNFNVIFKLSYYLPTYMSRKI